MLCTTFHRVLRPLLLSNYEAITRVVTQSVRFNSESEPVNKTSAKPIAVKTEFVLLVDENGKVLGTRTKTEAEAFAAKKHMMLQLIDNHAESKKRVAYKLVAMWDRAEKVKSAATSHQHQQHRQQQQQQQILVKTVSMNFKISDNDLSTKLKQICGWLSKPKTEIRVSIAGKTDTKETALEEVFKKIEQGLEGTVHRVLQKRVNNGSLKFTLVPLKTDAK